METFYYDIKNKQTCDFCNEVARFDAPTLEQPQAYFLLCRGHFEEKQGDEELTIRIRYGSVEDDYYEVPTCSTYRMRGKSL